MAAPRMKAPVKKKKTTVKKPKVGTVKSPEETRKSISRKQVGTQRPARGVTPQGAKARALTGVKQPGTSLTVTNKGSLTTPNKRAVAKTGEQVAEKARTAITRTAKNAVGFAEKWIPNAIKPKGGGMGLINKVGGVATAATSIVNPEFMNFKTEKTKAGELEAAKPSGSLMGGRKLTDKENAANAFRKKPSGTYFPTAKSKVSSTTGAGRPEYPSSNKGKKSSTSGNKSRVGNPGGARALENVSDRKNGTSKAASVTASSGSSGGSQASKSGVGRQTRYQRNELAMEQRKRSSSKPKKSIFSLFRKG